ncbi:hypothetical protein J5N97_007535 [Dioscorea zingiberensis]|uniref:Uncharacterized protein n=1 Tax=Dioscorea zingiberensis TaxID=325984 RepID=A0A9D5HUB9_9LILI|nr:hypothetical protein J5N97_007535 [Dioscorea zingiberensis]
MSVVEQQRTRDLHQREKRSVNSKSNGAGDDVTFLSFPRINSINQSSQMKPISNIQRSQTPFQRPAHHSTPLSIRHVLQSSHCRVNPYPLSVFLSLHRKGQDLGDFRSSVITTETEGSGVTLEEHPLKPGEIVHGGV